MEWYETPERYLAVSVSVAAAAIVVIRLNISNTEGLVYPIISIGICFPIIIFSTYLWITGRGKRVAMGLDRNLYTEEEIREYVSYYGFWHMLSGLLFLFGLSILFVNAFIGLAAAITAAMILTIAMTMPSLGKDVNGLVEMSSVKAMGIILLVLFLSLVLTTPLFIEGVHNMENGSVNGYNPFKFNELNNVFGGEAKDSIGVEIEEYNTDPISSVDGVYVDHPGQTAPSSGHVIDTVFYNVRSMTPHGMV